jgi:hypothetical protein
LAAALWGFDIGLVFTTWFKFSGVWLLVIITILVGEPTFGVVVFILYWLGRAISVWIAPLLMQDASTTSQLLDALNRQHLLFQQIHVLGLALLVVVLLFWLIYGIPVYEKLNDLSHALLNL